MHFHVQQHGDRKRAAGSGPCFGHVHWTPRQCCQAGKCLQVRATQYIWNDRQTSARALDAQAVSSSWRVSTGAWRAYVLCIDQGSTAAVSSRRHAKFVLEVVTCSHWLLMLASLLIPAGYVTHAPARAIQRRWYSTPAALIGCQAVGRRSNRSLWRPPSRWGCSCELDAQTAWIALQNYASGANSCVELRMSSATAQNSSKGCCMWQGTLHRVCL
jgi:hypothetical protein